MPKNVQAAVDTEVTVPAAVVAAAARSEALIAAQNPPAEPEVSVVEPVAAPAAPVVEPVAPAAPATVVEPVTPKVTAPADEQTFEHKYNSMKGRYDALARQVAPMTEQIRNLQELLAAPQPAVAVASPQAETLVTDAERAEWGGELLDVVGKRAREELLPVVANLQRQVQNLTEREEREIAAKRTANQSTFYTTLNTELPDWKAINHDPKFLDYLALPDTYSGAIRRELLNSAVEQLNAPRALAFFKGFLAEEAALAPREGQPDLNPTVVPSSKVPLETFAAPGRAKTPAAHNPAPDEKPSFTRAHITQFYIDVANRKYAGRDELKAKLEAQIFEAQREGRIT